MKRLWLGVGILLVILALGIITAMAAGQLHNRIARDLMAAGNAAQAGNWQEAQGRFQQARALWQENRDGTAATTDHAHMEEIDRFFAQGEVYLEREDPGAFSACCRGLSVLVEAIADAQKLTWWSLL